MALQVSNLSLVVPYSFNHEILAKAVIGYSRSTLFHANKVGHDVDEYHKQVPLYKERNKFWNILTCSKKSLKYLGQSILSHMTCEIVL